MSEQSYGTQAGTPADPSPYAAQVHPAYAPPPPKPPLTRRARRGAMIAGVVSFCVLSLGWALLLTSVMLGFLGGLVAWIAQLIRVGGSADADDRLFIDFVETTDIGAWVPLLVVAGLVGLGLMVLALFTSRWILGGHGVNRAWAVTWAATGIAIVASWILGGVLGALLQLLPLAFSAADWVTAVVTILIISGVSSLLLTAAIGLFSWWWMAHAMRPRDAVAG